MSRRLCVLILAAVLGAPATSLARHRDLVGTVTAIDGASITLRTKRGPRTVTLGRDIAFVARKGDAVSVSSLRIGSKVVVTLARGSKSARQIRILY